MAYYVRLGRRYRRYRKYRRFYRRYRRGYARRYVNATSRSSIRCKCVVTGSSTLSSGYGTTLGSVFKILPLSVANEATNPVPVVSNPLFQAYQHLYEEMKMIGMKVEVSVTDQIGGSTLPSLQIYTAWDRRQGQGEAAYTADNIKNSASNNIATALNNNVAKITRSIYASDLIEKAQWFDSTSVNNAAGGTISAWNSAAANPNFFCPAFFMCFGSPSLNAASAVASVHFSISVTYYVAFRNPKYGGSSSSSSLAAKSAVFPDDDEDLDDDKMDDDVFAQMESAPSADVPAPDPDAVQRRNAQIAANRRTQSQARVVQARSKLVGQVGPVQKN